MRTKYEEKTYENYFNSELSQKAKIFFPIGQVQEGNFGFDAAFFLKNNKIWRKFGLPYPFWKIWHYPFSGVDVMEIANEMEYYLQKELDHLPNMKTNLLFQYKKPEYISYPNGKEWHFWNKPYFRYSIYGEQQDLLTHIHNKFGNEVLVLYAAPAVKTIDELVEKYIQKKIIENSNFTKAIELNNHKRNTYIEAGTYSIACSEPEKLKKIDLLKQLEITSEIKYGDNDNSSNKELIVNFKNKISNIIRENKLYGKSFLKLNENLKKISEYKLLHSFLVMQNFKQLTGIQWLITLT